MNLKFTKAIGSVAAAAGLLFTGAIVGSEIDGGRVPVPPVTQTPIIRSNDAVDESWPSAAFYEQESDVMEPDAVSLEETSEPVANHTPVVAVETPVAKSDPILEPTAAPVTTQEPATPASTPVPAPDAPQVLAISPADSDIGVDPASAVQVTFSESMDQDSVEDAFSLSSGGCGSFSWNGPSTVVTYQPCDEWPYGTEVAVEIDESAESADGASFDDGFESRFRVLRQSRITLYSQAEFDGSVYHPYAPNFAGQVNLHSNGIGINLWTRGFISFDLSQLPADSIDIQFAEVNVFLHTPNANSFGPATGPLLIESVNYGTLNVEDIYLPAYPLCSKICIGSKLTSKVVSSSVAVGRQTVEMTVAVRNDWNDRDERGLRSQFRLRWDVECQQNCAEDTQVVTYAGGGSGPAPSLEIVYSHP